MTRNQIEYWKNVETNRSNLATELETNRTNLAREAETKRANIENERIARERLAHDIAAFNQSHLLAVAQQREVSRSNESKEAEAKRSNIVNEDIRNRDLDITSRKEKTTYAVSQQNLQLQKAILNQTKLKDAVAQSNQLLQMQETNRANVASEQLRAKQLASEASYREAQKQLNYQQLNLQRKIAEETERSNRTSEMLTARRDTFTLVTNLAKSFAGAGKLISNLLGGIK